MVEVLEASYSAGARGIEAIPIGKIVEAAKYMVENHKDYVITGSTYPGSDSGIDKLIDVSAKLIFVHGMISDNKGKKLLKLIDELNSKGIMAGIATHDPVPTIKFAIEQNLKVKAFLIPFNANGVFMGNQSELEKIVDNTKGYSFIGMKTLAAGNIDPENAFNYISKHNICAVSIGMISKEEAQETTMVALKKLKRGK